MTTGRAIVVQGDAAHLPLPDASVAAVVCDPPYGLEFMGRDWDTFKPASAQIRRPSARDQAPGAAHNASTSLVARNVPEAYVAGPSFQRWCEAWAAEVFRVLKPGGYLAAFGGTRTYHRLACGIEDAGFEIRDSLDWLYGSGFPKSLDVGKAIDKAAREVVGTHYRHGGGSAVSASMAGPLGTASELPATAPATAAAAAWDGWGTALKPAHEPIVLARKPLTGTVAANVLAYGTGALNIDACLVEHASPADLAESEGKNRHADFGSGPRDHQGVYQGQPAADRAQYDGSGGRWPPNVVLTHDPACDIRDEGNGEIWLEGQCVPGCPVAELDDQSGASVSRIGRPRASAKPGDGYGMTHTGTEYADAGGASRFFPVFRYAAKAGTAERPRLPDGTSWPTVKPVPIMRWLVRLLTPPGGLVLDLFSGTGTTGEAAIIEGFDVVLLDKDPQAIALTRVRMARPIQPLMFGTGPQPRPRAAASARPTPVPPPASLFDDPDGAVA